MLKKFYPYEHVSSVFSIDYNKLYAKGYRGIIFDVDNTLVHHGDDSTKEVDDLFKYIQSIGFKTILLSNNGEKRIKRFLNNIDSLYICNANKPKTHNYFKAIELLECDKDECVYIGDQIFVDIVGANKCNIPNILVDFIRLEGEVNFGKKRKLENIILKMYQKSNSARNRIGNIEIKG